MGQRERDRQWGGETARIISVGKRPLTDPMGKIMGSHDAVGLKKQSQKQSRGKTGSHVQKNHAGEGMGKGRRKYKKKNHPKIRGEDRVRTWGGEKKRTIEGNQGKGTTTENLRSGHGKNKTDAKEASKKRRVGRRQEGPGGGQLKYRNNKGKRVQKVKAQKNKRNKPGRGRGWPRKGKTYRKSGRGKHAVMYGQLGGGRRRATKKGKGPFSPRKGQTAIKQRMPKSQKEGRPGKGAVSKEGRTGGSLKLGSTLEGRERGRTGR